MITWSRGVLSLLVYWHVRQGDVSIRWSHQGHGEAGLEGRFIKAWKCFPRVCWLKL